MSNQRDQIEATLADLAVQTVSEKLPSIFDYYLGFELIERNDEGTRAAGLLGFQIKDQLCYIPVMFLNGRIKGHEMIRLDGPDLYISGSKQWVEFLASTTPGGAAAGAPDMNWPRGGVSGAQLQVYRTPQTGSGKVASSDDGPDLIDFLKAAGADVHRDFLKAAQARPGVMEGILTHYGDRIMIPWSEFAVHGETSKAADLLSDAGDPEEGPALMVVTDPSSVDAGKLDEEGRALLMETGIAIVDSRPESDRTIVIKEETRQRFGNPEETAVYELVSYDLSLNEVLASPTPFPIEDVRKPLPGHILVDVSAGLAFHAHNPDNGNLERRSPVVRHVDPDGRKLRKVLDGAKPLSSMKVGKTYVMVDTGDCPRVSAPFEVLNKAGARFRCRTPREISWNLNDRHNWWPRPSKIEDDFQRIRGASPHVYGPASAEVLNSGVWVETIDGLGGEPYRTDSSVAVPERFRVIEARLVSEDDIPGSGGCRDTNGASTMLDGSGDRGSDAMKVVPARMGEVNAIIHFAARPGSLPKTASVHGIRTLRVERVSGGLREIQVQWNGKTASYREPHMAVAALVRGIGLGEADARSIVSRASSYERVSEDLLHPKMADGGSMDIPWPDMDDGYGETPYSGTPMTTRIIGISQGTPEDPDIDPFDHDRADYGAISRQMAGGMGELVERAAQSGVKQVFDASAMSMLLNTSRVQSRIDEDYLPYLIKGVDRACRLLLQFYWHNAEFSDTYGKDEMAEFEDVLLTYIKLGGKTVLFLKQKSANPEMSGLNALDEVA